MSCYFRHLKDVFHAAAIQVNPNNRKRIDQAIHQMVGAEYKNCPDAWKKLKKQILADEHERHEFAVKLKEALSGVE